MRSVCLLLVLGLLSGCCCRPPAQLLKTGQVQCSDKVSNSLGACPGDPSGQDAQYAFGAARDYRDNADGTISDRSTGLTWEKLDDNDAGGIHDIDNGYTWYQAYDKVAALNAAKLGGHDDWRLPNIEELWTVTDYGRRLPAVDPIFHTGCVPGCVTTACSCTKSIDGPFAGSEYWSSTSRPNDPNYNHAAWVVRGKDGASITVKKSDQAKVRAVRGGAQ
jgi:hypothetical protein